MDNTLFSECRTIAAINPDHQVFLVQHQPTRRIYILKIMDVFNAGIYQKLLASPIEGTPRILACQEQDGRLSVIEEYLSGTPLSGRIAEGSLSEDEIASIMRDLCGVISRLHAMIPPVIHRDIKPSNILVMPYGRAVLLDFNAAKFYSPNTQEDTTLLGTKGYAAPEQYGFGSSLPQTDIYALGVVLKEMVSSLKRPSRRFDAIIDKCTQMNPKERYASAGELLAALEPGKRGGSYAIPGFRTRTPWKMAFASVTYLFIPLASATYTIREKLDAGQNILERVCFALCCLSVIFISFNYRDVQRFLPLCKSRSKLLRFAGILLFDAAAIFVIVFIMLIIEPYL